MAGEALGRPMPLPWLIRALLPRKRLDALRRMMGYAVRVRVEP